MTQRRTIRRIGLVWLVLVSLVLTLPLEAGGRKKTRVKGCRGNLDIDAYEELSDSARKTIQRALDTHEAALESETWREFDRRMVGARKLLKKSARMAKGCALPKFYLGRSFSMTSVFPTARKRFEEAIEINPQFYEAMAELASVVAVEKEFDRALELCERALKICPTYPNAVYYKARYLIRTERIKEAKDFLYNNRVSKKEKEAYAATKSLYKQCKLALEGPDWEETYTVESENYVLKTDHSQRLAKELSEVVERILKVYEKAFPEIEKPKRKYQIWVYSDADSYKKAGNHPNSLGLYDPTFRRLTLFRQNKMSETRSTLQHEAFHQYLHDYVELAPSWFNEGLGDYFGAFKPVPGSKSGRMRPEPDRGRLRVIKRYIRRCPPVSVLMKLTQRQMYGTKYAGVLYAQAWSVIYFIGENPSKGYLKYLKAYFRLLRKGKNRIEAYEKTFGKLDMERFEREWKAFVLEL